MLSHALLVATSIVPEDWEIDENGETMTPAMGISLNYKNGIEWTLNPSQLTISEECKGRFLDHYLVHDLANSYLRVFSRFPYENLGINWNVSVKSRDPDGWLMQRFLQAQGWFEDGTEIIFMRPNFMLKADGAVCNLDFSTARFEMHDGETENVVVVDCNVHHPNLLNAEQLSTALAQWNGRQSFVLTALHSLLGPQQQ